MFEGLVDFLCCVAHVENIEKLNDDHVDLEIDEFRCFEIVRSFSSLLATKETAVYAPV